MPLAVPVTVKLTVVAVELAPLVLIVNWPLLAGSAATASLATMLIVAVSSVSLIVTVAVRSGPSGSSVTCGSPTTLVSVTMTVSSPSTSTSDSNVTSNVTEVARAGTTMLVPSAV